MKEIVGNNLRRIRNNLTLSQDDLAAAINGLQKD